MPRTLTAALLLVLAAAGCNSDRPRVVLYCAQDPEFAEAVLADFTAGGGPPVAPKFDTEANKSVGLVEELVREHDRPRCDVHWNNEIIGTIRLQRQGLLEPYESPAATPYPAWAKAPDHTWTAFAARARVLLVNTKLVPEAERPKRLLELTDAKWRGRVAMAKPQFGTTATQAACLFEAIGPEAAKAFYRGLKANEVQLVAGNKQSAEAVSEGRAAVGLTDTDDALEEVHAGKPVVIVFPDAAGDPDHPKMGTLFIPNTVAVVKGCPHPDAARRLVDYLLGPAVEKRLAEGGGYQIPLNPAVQANLPPELAPARSAKVMEVDFGKAADRWAEAQAFLAEVFGH